MSFFSILIPTRERCEYLKYALDSALSQTLEDLEVVVSDNASQDSTKEVVESMDDLRIKYFRTKRFVNVGENFNNAYRNSSGKYFILMGDDDILMPYYLEKIYEYASKNSEPDVFLSNTAQFDYRTNKLQIYSGTNFSFVEVDKQNIIRRYFDFVPAPHNPTMGCFAKRIAEKVCIDGNLYGGPFPDYLANFSMVTNARRIFKTDTITNITTVTKKSLCIKQFSTNINARRSIFVQTPLLKSVPTPIEGEYIHVNGFYQTLVLLKERFPEETSQYAINKRLYYESMGRELVALTFKDFKGFDVTYLRKLASFCLKISFSVFLTFIFLHFPVRLIYGIMPEKIQDKAVSLYLKTVKKKPICITMYFGKSFNNILDIKEKVFAYEKNRTKK